MLLSIRLLTTGQARSHKLQASILRTLTQSTWLIQRHLLECSYWSPKLQPWERQLRILNNLESLFNSGLNLAMVGGTSSNLSTKFMLLFLAIQGCYLQLITQIWPCRKLLSTQIAFFISSKTRSKTIKCLRTPWIWTSQSNQSQNSLSQNLHESCQQVNPLAETIYSWCSIEVKREER